MNAESTSFPSITVSSTRAMHVLLKLAVLLNLINPGKLLERPSSSSHDDSRLPMLPWHRFLDEFAWLGDTRKGGESVTGVAGLVTSGRPVLLVARNHGINPNVLAHLQLVLKLLQSLSGSNVENRSEVQRQILEISVRASHNKVRNYGIRLMKAITYVTTCTTMLTLAVDAPFRLVLADVKNLVKDHLTLCDWAYNFTKSGNLVTLDQKCNIQPKVPAFHRLRHYIGRLGAWHRASGILTKIASESPELIASLTLEAVPPRPLLCRSPQADRHALQHLMVDLQLELGAEQVLKKLQALYDTARGGDEDKPIDIETAFWERLVDPTMKPMVHAEVLIAEHSFDSGLSFIGNDRYIGCSKPSCVSCHFYMGAHPLGIVSRGCHDNLWPKWYLPCSASQDIPNHVESLVCSMIWEFRRMMLDRLMNGRTITQRLPDSVTGITRSTAEWEKS